MKHLLPLLILALSAPLAIAGDINETLDLSFHGRNPDHPEDLL